MGNADILQIRKAAGDFMQCFSDMEESLKMEEGSYDPHGYNRATVRCDQLAASVSLYEAIVKFVHVALQPGSRDYLCVRPHEPDENWPARASHLRIYPSGEVLIVDQDNRIEVAEANWWYAVPEIRHQFVRYGILSATEGRERIAYIEVPENDMETNAPETITGHIADESKNPREGVAEFAGWVYLKDKKADTWVRFRRVVQDISKSL